MNLELDDFGFEREEWESDDFTSSSYLMGFDPPVRHRDNRSNARRRHHHAAVLF